MGTKSPEVEAYIAKSAEFARPILEKIRTLFHAACPEIEETMKWSFPHFECQGIVGSMAGFKKHVSFGFWKGSLLDDWQEQFEIVGKTTMSAAKVTNLSDLPPDTVIKRCIKQAVKLNKDGIKAEAPAAKKGAAKKKAGSDQVPDDLAAALKKNKKAQAAFEGFSPSHRREYIEWITEAKQEATRERRLATAIAWLAEGKPRNWKYMKTR
jgi:uncharacterized protein YdeI (YjbR/CyaY-like superfamily)